MCLVYSPTLVTHTRLRDHERLESLFAQPGEYRGCCRSNGIRIRDSPNKMANFA